MRPIVPAAAPLSELATRLRMDADGSAKLEYSDMFEAARAAAKQRLREPLPTDEFEIQTALEQGAGLCSDVISAVWNALHR